MEESYRLKTKQLYLIKYFSRIKQWSVVVLSACSIVACGGSSGGGSNSNVSGGNAGNAPPSMPPPPAQAPALIAGQSTGSVQEDGTGQASGLLTITDAQANEAAFQAQSNVVVNYGTFSIDSLGAWSYTLDQTSPELNVFPAGYSENLAIEVFSVDGTLHALNITVNGANDAASFEIGAPVSLSNNEGEPITGAVAVSDIDLDESQFVVQQNISTDYGRFSISASGVWNYSLDVNNNQVVSLSDGQSLSDAISISSLDGSTTDLVITVNGMPTSGFVVSSQTSVVSDGPNNGLTAYELIENAFGEGSIEAPDFYPSNHDDVVHIIEDTDAVVGNHFVFLAHRDLDHDRSGGPSDRQRNEIKTFDRSDQDLLGYEGETFQYTWKFKVSSELELTSRFTHFFQIKAKNYSEDNSNGNDNQPVFTLSGAEQNSSGNELQLRYSAGFNPDGSRTSDVYLVRHDWDAITDEWLEVFVQITYAEAGKFDMTITRMRDDNIIFDISEDNIDTYRGVETRDFSRPKWGIYRSILERSSLRAEEEQVRFADFTIRKGRGADTRD